MLKRARQLQSSGDTIVEVMIALAVLGLALSISYATANRSMLGAREAQENAEATVLVQSQIERLRTLTDPASVVTSALPPKLPTDAGGIFNSSNGVPPAVYCVVLRSPLPPLPQPQYEALLATDTKCTGFNGTRYALAVDYLGTGTNHTFVVKASWDNVRGEGKDTVELDYRIYP